MGVSTRSRPRTPIRSAIDRTEDAAMTARAHGLLTESQLEKIIDGRVTKADIRTAEKILTKAEDLLCEIEDSSASDYDHVSIAEDRLAVAETLLDAISEQYDTQKSGSDSSSRRPARRRPSGK
jgi:hypothetical protein